ncbi:biopolymer transporter ExbD [Nitratireductor aquimarinus]|uniref:ExbD/TolR family protein n=1 Tax=Alphaproteobacteria TaxID=28211 RepID=UPI0019D35076|nr:MULTISPECIES: biopolymer transporter ExbD [Alphaproteobacteria]MBY6021323.1 biopolymer transporter ExbD [Nitratireductor sp. DP7N14-4]MBN7756537.1 biopolymer transporter ExbD [Nitratireductor aquimarinus]MBN8241512.1 biopolymer transporter ExbD [Nitratireductor aquimarinus]MBY5999296.1 biopolymer transporter ExbD [Tritonibacter mobilis]MBY6129898.1 biopolymer transporter ExbD [Nitratireductor aquimarinus]
MLRLARPTQTRQRESTIALINIVFLMLIFFLVAGTLTPPLDNDVSLISTIEADRSQPPDALFVTSEGEMRLRGTATDAQSFMLERVDTLGETAARELEIKVAADRELPAAKLVDIVGALKAAGASRISIITERVPQ